MTPHKKVHPFTVLEYVSRFSFLFILPLGSALSECLNISFSSKHNFKDLLKYELKQKMSCFVL